MAVAAIAAIALLAGGAAWALSRDDEDPGGDPVAAGEATGEVPDGTTDSTAPPETTSTTAPLPPEYVEISDVVLEGGQYRVDYEVLGYSPEIGGPGTLHIHFFPDTQPAATAGTNGGDTDDWFVTDEAASVLTDYTPEIIEAGATQMCAAVADHLHGVHSPDVSTGNCVALPT